jgi:putative transposase
VRNKAVYVALGVRPDGSKEVLGLWIEQTEGAKFWLRVMNELRNRGVLDMLIAVVDGLKGFPEAINAVFPQAQIQTCIVHLIRHSLAFASWKERRGVAAALKSIYRAANAEHARQQLDEFAAGFWGRRYPAIAPAWQRQWEQVVPFFAYPMEVRKIIYTTDEIDKLFRHYSGGARVTAWRASGPRMEARPRSTQRLSSFAALVRRFCCLRGCQCRTNVS